ncbi:MAG: hypothetical protein FD163_2501 [Hyphomonadaceae bacterium]|nr:MAG: hypothetical protein FD163_2501 [Hyphomonadaceae bacterium]
MKNSTLEAWADESNFHARDFITGIVTYASDELDYLVAEEWLNCYLHFKDVALSDCRIPGATYSKPRFFISMRDLPKHNPHVAAFTAEKAPCLMLEAGFHQIPLILFLGADLGSVLAAFDNRLKTLDAQGREITPKAKVSPKPMEYAA